MQACLSATESQNNKSKCAEETAHKPYKPKWHRYSTQKIENAN